MCGIAGFFWLAAGFWLFLGTVLKGGSETVIMFVIMALLAIAFSYGVIATFPFEPITMRAS